MAGPDGKRRLTPYEIAEALSYSLTDGPPDEPLWRAAADGTLKNPATIIAQARRLLAADQQHGTLPRYLREYFRYPQAVAIQKTGVQNHQPVELIADTDATVKSVLDLHAGKDFLRTLLTTNVGFAGRNTAAVYGLTSTAMTPTEVKWCGRPAARLRWLGSSRPPRRLRPPKRRGPLRRRGSGSGSSAGPLAAAIGRVVSRCKRGSRSLCAGRDRSAHTRASAPKRERGGGRRASRWTPAPQARQSGSPATPVTVTWRACT